MINDQYKYFQLSFFGCGPYHKVFGQNKNKIIYKHIWKTSILKNWDTAMEKI